MHDVFISYSSKDQKTADAVVNYLESAKVRCWIAYRDAQAGALYAASIIKAIRTSAVFLLVFSENSNNSKHVLKEIDAACKYEKIIIPFRIDACQLDDAVEYYLSATHWLDAISAPMDNHLKNLVNIVNKYLEKTTNVISDVKCITSELAEDKAYSQLKVLSGIEVTEKDLKEALILDRLVYSNVFSIEKDLSWYKINPDIYFMLKDIKLNTVVGYINVAPITENCFEKILKGKLRADDVNEDSILAYDFHGIYYLYFISIVVNPLYRSFGAINKLTDAVISKIIDLSKQEIYFKAMVADALKSEGEKYCRMFGMDFITDSNHDSKIYSVSFLPPKFKKSSKSLVALADIYEQFDDSDMVAF